MASIVVVSRNTALSVAFTHAGYDVNEVRPDRHGDWMTEARLADALVLELSDAVAAESAVQRLRGEGVGVPVLIVSNARPGWETTAQHAGAGTAVMGLPISFPGLQGELERLLAAGPITVPPPPANETELLNAVAASVGLAIGEHGRLERDGATDPPEVAAAEPEPEPVAEPEPEPAPPLSTSRPLPAPPPPFPAPPVRPAAPAAPRAHAPGTADELVVALLGQTADLLGVTECAEVVASEFAERLAAEAVALLLPDGQEWRVAAGVGLRPLEYRVRLAPDHWLIDTVVTTGKALVLDDTDAVRDELIGAPLASWPRLLAVPVPDVAGVFVGARRGEAFRESVLPVAVDVAAEAAPLLRDALAVRALARALAAFTDTDDA